VKIRPRCDHVEKGLRCPNSAGYVPTVHQVPGGRAIVKGKFCLQHVGKRGDHKMSIDEARRHGVRVDLTA
jgi:hypothetical protein